MDSNHRHNNKINLLLSITSISLLILLIIQQGFIFTLAQYQPRQVLGENAATICLCASLFGPVEPQGPEEPILSFSEGEFSKKYVPTLDKITAEINLKVQELNQLGIREQNLHGKITSLEGQIPVFKDQLEKQKNPKFFPRFPKEHLEGRIKTLSGDVESTKAELRNLKIKMLTLGNELAKLSRERVIVERFITEYFESLSPEKLKKTVREMSFRFPNSENKLKLLAIRTNFFLFCLPLIAAGAFISDPNLIDPTKKDVEAAKEGIGTFSPDE